MGEIVVESATKRRGGEANTKKEFFVKELANTIFYACRALLRSA